MVHAAPRGWKLPFPAFSMLHRWHQRRTLHKGIIVCMYVWSSHIARIRINRVRLPILLVISWTGKINVPLSPFAPENLASRGGFGSPAPRQYAYLHTQAESGAYLRNSSRFPRRRPFILKPPCTIGSVPSLSVHAITYRWRSLPRVRQHRASKLQGSPSNGCCLGRSPWTMTNYYAPLIPTLLMILVWSGHVESTGGVVVYLMYLVDIM